MGEGSGGIPRHPFFLLLMIYLEISISLDFFEELLAHLNFFLGLIILKLEQNAQQEMAREGK